MKIPWLSSFKIPGLQRRKELPPRTPARPLRSGPGGTVYRARGRTAEPEDFEEEQPTTRLSTAFIVVVALHLVLVGGIYAFNSIKANRPMYDAAADKAKPAPAAPKQSTAPIEKPAPQNLAVPSAPLPKIASNPTLPIANSKIHQVKSGDTLTKIAQLHNVTTGELAEANGLKESAILRPGQSLNIPNPHVAGVTRSESNSHVSSAARSEAETRAAFVKAQEGNKKSTASTPAKVIPKTHTVGKNETLAGIVRKYGVQYDELVKLNKIEDPKKLQIGTVLKLPQPKTASN
jgi:LysM repeat protein